MNRHDVQAVRTAAGGQGRLRRRLAVAALLIGLGAVASVVPHPASPFEGIAAPGGEQHTTP
ncbi:hypothetical protein [Actinomadura rudentiformis]|uniref:Uncharacterized protein n=1 Tax=Actinomadura rudentiformis TaxID=359158 RepID=A0A6H9YV88_9ACTN|nr:hypothetical protein [Actinomadura rudentiformis]KAB2348505.1 hypothetical protein F8566_17130 [Actinomadura rudentiformis]